MNDDEQKDHLGELINLAMDCLGVAVTIIDTNGEIIFVTLSPIIKNGKFIGCVQTVRPKNTAS